MPNITQYIKFYTKIQNITVMNYNITQIIKEGGGQHTTF